MGERQTCTRLHARAKYVGNYDNHECEIEITNVSAEDSGVWSCDVESYVFGATSGYKVKKELTLLVKPVPTSTTSTINVSSSSSTTKSTTTTEEILTPTSTATNEVSTDIVEEVAETTITNNEEGQNATIAVGNSSVIAPRIDLDAIRDMADDIPDDFKNQPLTSVNTATVPIILGSAAAVFVVLIIVVLFVYRRHKRVYADKMSKVTMNELESEQFANQMAEDEWPDNETNPESSKFNLTVDAEIDSRPPSFKYIGATSFDVTDDAIIKTSTNTHM